jgi:uncharacterized protein (UPF0332 family)
LTDENRRHNARAEAGLGDDALAAAEALLAALLPNDAISRAYYAAFHYARALLLARGLEPKTHRGVLSLLAEHWEKPGGMSRDAISALARLQTFRGLADYDASARLTDERAREEVQSARGFVVLARAVLGSEGILV